MASKYLWAAFRSTSRGALGGILDTTFGKIAGLLGLTVILGGGYLIITELTSEGLASEMQTVVTASVSKYQRAGSFPNTGLETSLARTLRKSGQSDGASISVGPYAVHIGSGETGLPISTGDTSIIGDADDFATAVSIPNSGRAAYLIVDGIDSANDCETLMTANPTIGELKGMWVVRQGEALAGAWKAPAAITSSRSDGAGPFFHAVGATDGYDEALNTHSLAARQGAADVMCQDSDYFPMTLAYGYTFR